MPLPSFSKPDDIYAYGKTIDRFNEAMKQFNVQLNQLGFEEEQRRPISGHSPYNTIKNTVVQDPEQYREAINQPGKKRYEGLYGIFFFLHLPEMKMAKHMAGILGRDHGFRIKCSVDGIDYFAPLNDVIFDYTDTPPEIVLSKPLVLSSVDGVKRTLDSGTCICSDTVRIRAKQEKLAVPFEMVDGHGKMVEPDTAAIVYWQSLGAEAMKSREEARRRTLAFSGTDDDFTAERFMINAMEDLQLSHGVDLMPQFNAYVAEAVRAVESNTDFMQAWKMAVQLDKTFTLPLTSDDRGRWRHLRNQSKELGAVARYFGIDFSPALSADSGLTGGALEPFIGALEAREAQTRVPENEWKLVNTYSVVLSQFEKRFHLGPVKKITWSDASQSVIDVRKKELAENEALLRIMGDELSNAPVPISKIPNSALIQQTLQRLGKPLNDDIKEADLPEVKQQRLKEFRLQLEQIAQRITKSAEQREEDKKTTVQQINESLNSPPPVTTVRLCEAPVKRAALLAGASAYAIASTDR